MNRDSFIRAPHFFLLNQACATLAEAFGPCIYLVGSSLQRRDHGDVDIRCILDDASYDALFPGGGGALSAMWSVMCSSISLWLSQQTGLLVDFQFQHRSRADEDHPNAPRKRIGVFVSRDAAKEAAPREDSANEDMGHPPEPDVQLSADDVTTLEALLGGSEFVDVLGLRRRGLVQQDTYGRWVPSASASAELKRRRAQGEGVVRKTSERR